VAATKARRRRFAATAIAMALTGGMAAIMEVE
jgi:hypothetical protein